MRKRDLAVLCCCPCLPSTLLRSRNRRRSVASPLEPVAWLVGGTWISDVKDPQDGSVTHVENRITWAPNHQAINSVTNFNGKPHYNGFYAYNPAAKTIGFYYTNSEGQLTIGTSVPDPDGKTLQQDFEVIQPDGKTGHTSVPHWCAMATTRIGSPCLCQKGGRVAHEVFKIRYERK